MFIVDLVIGIVSVSNLLNHGLNEKRRYFQKSFDSVALFLFLRNKILNLS